MLPPALKSLMTFSVGICRLAGALLEPKVAGVSPMPLPASASRLGRPAKFGTGALGSPDSMLGRLDEPGEGSIDEIALGSPDEGIVGSPCWSAQGSNCGCSLSFGAPCILSKHCLETPVCHIHMWQHRHKYLAHVTRHQRSTLVEAIRSSKSCNTLLDGSYATCSSASLHSV